MNCARCKTTGWLLPAVILALVPKCPACLVIYIALATGLGISLSTATYLRSALILLCGSALVYVAAKAIAASSNGASTESEHEA